MNEHRKLARLIAGVPDDVLEADEGRSAELQIECQRVGYVWGDLFIQVLRCGRQARARSDEKQLRRVGVLRAELRGIIAHDARAVDRLESEFAMLDEMS